MSFWLQRLHQAVATCDFNYDNYVYCNLDTVGNRLHMKIKDLAVFIGMVKVSSLIR